MTRRKHRYPETTAPSPEDAPLFAAWCAQWELDPKDPHVVACADYHSGKGTLWRDWRAAVRTWKRRERPTANGTNGRHWVQPPGGQWKPGESERKAEDIADDPA